MTARFAELPYDLVRDIADEILDLPGVVAVGYRYITHKPPRDCGMGVRGSGSCEAFPSYTRQYFFHLGYFTHQGSSALAIMTSCI